MIQRKQSGFFKERGIKYQFIDMKEKGMSKGEFNSVAQINGGSIYINWCVCISCGTGSKGCGKDC